MIAFETTRGDARALIASLLPHAGKESDDTPLMGRVRFELAPDALVAWATDHATVGLGTVPVTDHLDGELGSWDMPTTALRAMLAVFRGPTNLDARMMWADGALRWEIGPEFVTFTEVGEMLEGQSLTTGRIVPAGTVDQYPDVPRTLEALSGMPLAHHQAARVPAAHLVPLLNSAKAWAGVLRLDVLAVDDGKVASLRVRASCGSRFVGASLRSAGTLTPQNQTDDRETDHEWAAIYARHKRPAPTTPPTSDDPTEHGATARTLTVVRDDS